MQVPEFFFGILIFGTKHGGGIFPESVKGHGGRDVLRISIIKAEIHQMFDLFIS